jgi:glycosyltransferase involved in cell wall biosynthesis
MRVLMVNDIALDEGWGAELHLSRLADGLRDAGDTVEVFAGEVSHRGVSRILDVWDPFARRALADRAERFRPDVVHYHNVLRELSVSVLGVPVGVPSVLTVHELRLLGVPDSPPRGPRDRAKQLLTRLHQSAARKHVDVFIGVSRVVVNRLQTAGFPVVEHVPAFAPAPDPALRPTPVAEARDVVFAGRLMADKGVAVLAAAFEQVAAHHREVRLVVAGEGPEASVVAALRDRLGGERVIVTGKLDTKGVGEWFARARVVVAPSIARLRPEGAGLTPIEAALLGRPVIVSDDPALREFTDESHGGLVVAAGSVPELTAALERIVVDDELAIRLGGNGQRVAHATRTTATVVPSVQAAYRRAMALREAQVA